MPEAWEDPAEARRGARPSRDPSDATHDDDELAAALREQLDRYTTGSIPIVAPAPPREGERRSGIPAGAPPVPSGSAASSGTPSTGGSAPPPVAGARPSWPTFAQAGSPSVGPQAGRAGLPGEQPGRRPDSTPSTPWDLPGAAPASPHIPPPAPAPRPDASSAPSTPDGVTAARPARRDPSPVPHFPPASPLPLPPRPEEPAALAQPAESPQPARSTEPASPTEPAEDAGEPAEVADEKPGGVEGGSALELLEQLAPQLSGIRLDPQTFSEWEQALRRIASEAPAVEPSPERGSAARAEPAAAGAAGVMSGERAIDHPEPGPRRRRSAFRHDTRRPEGEHGLRRDASAGPEGPTSPATPMAAPSEAEPRAARPPRELEAAAELPPPRDGADIEAAHESAPPRWDSEPDVSAAAPPTADPFWRSITEFESAASPRTQPVLPVDLPLPLSAPAAPQAEPSLFPPLPDPTGPVQLSQALPSLPVEEEHADDVIDAELIDEDDQPEPAREPSEATTGPLQLSPEPMPATDAAALAARAQPVVASGDDEDPPFREDEVAPLDLDGITTDTGPIRTGSVPIVAALDRDLDDDVDDLAPPTELLAVTGSIPLTPAAADTGPIAPVPSASVRTGTITLPVAESGPPSAFAVEEADLRPIEEEQRLRRPVAQFWLWLAPNSSALTLVLGASLLAFGISVRQAVLAAVLGVAVACLPLVVNVLAVKRASQPVAVASRATFGARGNLVPTAVLLLVRLFWAAALTWLAAGTVRSVLTSTGFDAVSPTVVGVALAVVLPVVAGLVAVFGHGLIARVHLVLGALSALLLLIVFAITGPLLDAAIMLSIPDGSALGLIGAAVAVASLLSVAWAAAGGELARYQQPGRTGAATAAWASLGAAAPALLVTSWGVLVAASAGSRAAERPDADPVESLLALLPSWAPIPLLLAAVLSLVAALATVLYSTGLTAGALGIGGSRAVRTAPAALIAVACGIPLVLADPPLAALLGGVLPVLAVPVLAWTGIMGAELLLRPSAFDGGSVLRRGALPAVRWPELTALVVISVIGIGLVARSEFAPAAGYLWALFGVTPDSALARSDLGVPLAVALGAGVALAVGIAGRRSAEDVPS